MPRGEKIWDEATVAKLRRLLAQGLSQTVIAERLGVTVSAVSSRVKRLRQEGQDG
jgi:DNA-binding Lrp family transcriptional regulator